MVHIYDNVTCEKDSSSMGKYLDEADGFLPHIDFGTSAKILGVPFNFEGSMFIFGIVFLLLACVGFIFLLIGCCEPSSASKRQEQVLNQDEEDQNHALDPEEMKSNSILNREDDSEEPE